MKIGRHEKIGIVSLCCIAGLVSGLFFSGCINVKKCVDGGIDWMLATSNLPLNDSVVSVFKSPDHVSCYKLFINDSDSVMRDTVPAIDMTKEQITVLQYLLLFDSRNYTSDSLVVQSPNIPVIEFEMEKKGYIPISVIVSFSDLSWNIVCDEETIGSYNYADHCGVRRFCNYFIQKQEEK